MYPASSNVINNDAPHLQFHNVLQYKDGKAIGSIADGARILAGMITQVNQNVQKNFSGKISRVSIHAKIKQAKKNREILFLREDQPDLGRPCAVYKKA